MDEQREYHGDLRRARKEYACGAIRQIGCSKKILSGDIYFCLTEQNETGFRTYRYCLDCAQQLYPGLVKRSSSAIKGASKQRAIGTRFQRAVFAERQSKYLRRRGTPPEEYLWSYLKDQQLGVAFFRQIVLQGYVIDFWCPELKLVLELDGKHHASRRQKDQRRDEILRQHGLTVIRFPALAVYSDVQVILNTIRDQREHTP